MTQPKAPNFLVRCEKALGLSPVGMAAALGYTVPTYRVLRKAPVQDLRWHEKQQMELLRALNEQIANCVAARSELVTGMPGKMRWMMEQMLKEGEEGEEASGGSGRDR